MTPQQKIEYQLSRICESIEFYRDIIKRRIRLIPLLSPADAQSVRFMLSNDKFMIKQLKAERKALVDSLL